MLIGKGGFGQVYLDPDNQNLAIKKFTSVKSVIQEVMLTKYFSESKFVVRIVSFDLHNKTTTMDAWPMSMSKAKLKYKWSEHQKYLIYRDVLYGLSHLQSRGILHADFKWSNVLYNPKDSSVCLCDLGLSCITKYAKTEQACYEFKSSDTVCKNFHFDMFALCLAMTELFSETQIVYAKKQLSRSELREYIAKVHFDEPLIRNSLLMMIPEDMNEIVTAQQICEYVFGEIAIMEMPKLIVYKNRIDINTTSSIKHAIYECCAKYKISRSKRCFDVCITYIHAHRIRKSSYYDVAIAFCFVYSCIFDYTTMSLSNAIERTKCTRKSFLDIVTNILNDDNVIAMTLDN